MARTTAAKPKTKKTKAAPRAKKTAVKKVSKAAPASKPARDGYVSRAILRNYRVSPQKARLVVNLVRGKKLGVALDTLDFCDKKTAPVLKKLLMSAAANAKQLSAVNVDELFIKRAWVDEGRKFKRFMPRAHGRATPIIKRHSTITVVLDEIGA